MSAQSYYKNRLGFDPQEALYDGAQSSSTIRSGSKSRTVHHQYSATVHHSNGNNNNNNNHYDYRSNSPAKKLKQSSASYTTSSSSTFVGGNGGNGGVSNNYNVANSSSSFNNNNTSQTDGYEDALTQFKGTMSIWEYFVENCDATGMTTWFINERYRFFSCFIILFLLLMRVICACVTFIGNLFPFFFFLFFNYAYNSIVNHQLIC